MKITSQLRQRFWSKVDKSGGPDACWPWTGRRVGGGYGNVFISKKTAPQTTTSNRLVLILAGKKMTTRHYACHSCDNPPCCNPKHIFRSTPTGNQADCEAKGRRPRGDRHHQTVIPDARVPEIRRRRIGGESLKSLASEFKVRESAISRICNFKRRPQIKPTAHVN